MPRAQPVAPKRPHSPSPSVSPPETTTTSTSSRRQPIPAHQRQRIALACDQCRAKKSRCDGRSPECRGCLAAGRECTYSKSGKKRGLAPGHTHRLELRVAMMEGLLGLLLCPDAAAAASGDETGIAERDRELERLVRQNRDRLREGRECRSYWTQSAAREALAEACGGEDGPLGALARKARRRRTNTVVKDEAEDDFFGRQPVRDERAQSVRSSMTVETDATPTPRPQSVVHMDIEEDEDDQRPLELGQQNGHHEELEGRPYDAFSSGSSSSRSPFNFQVLHQFQQQHYDMLSASASISTPPSSAALTETETESWVDFSLAGESVGFPMAMDDENMFTTIVDVDKVDAVDENWDGFMRQQRDAEADAEERRGLMASGGGIVIPW